MSQYNWNPDDEEQTPLEELQDYYPHVHVTDESFDEEWMDLMDEWEELSFDDKVAQRANRQARKQKKKNLAE